MPSWILVTKEHPRQTKPICPVEIRDPACACDVHCRCGNVGTVTQRNTTTNKEMKTERHKKAVW